MNARSIRLASGVRRITASYPTLHEANAGAAALVRHLAIDERRLHVVGLLQRRRLDETLMPASEDGLWREFVVTHLRAGVAGLRCGAWLWAACQVSGVIAVTASPLTSAVAFCVLGMFIGLLIAGLLIIGSSRRRPIDHIEATVVRGRWVLTVKTECVDEARRILAVLDSTGARIATVPGAGHLRGAG